MKNKIIKSLKTFCIILLMTACHKDETVQKSTMAFTINDIGNYSYWIVISDQKGNVLDWKSLQSAATTTLPYPANDTVNVTMIMKTSNGLYRINTFTKLISDNFVMREYPPIQNVTGNYALTISNPSDYTQIGVGSQCGYVENDNGNYTINVCGSSSSLYVWLQSDDSTPRYLFNPQIETSGSTVIDPTTYNSLPTMKYNQISFNESANTTAIVTGNMADGQNALVSYSYSVSLDPTSTFLDIYYPDPTQVGTLFNDYTIQLVYMSTTSDAPQHMYSAKTTDPYSFQPQDLQANLVGNLSATTSTISYQLSGNALASYVNLSTTNASWNIYSQFSKQISVVLPKFPDQLKQEAGLSFLSNLSAVGLGIFESTDFNEYKSFYEELFYSTTGVADYPNIKLISYPVKSDGTIGG